MILYRMKIIVISLSYLSEREKASDTISHVQF